MPHPLDEQFRAAAAQLAELGVDARTVLDTLLEFPVSLHCWQGDDVGGFEARRGALSGGIAVTGAYPGKARTIEELRADLDQAFALIPGRHRLNLHAIYGDFQNRAVPRNEIAPEHFDSWIEWAQAREIGLDFNPTCFSHPLAADGFTLSHRDPAVRTFWIEHCRRSREIAEHIGSAFGEPCVCNLWIPDGYKDTPADRSAPRLRLLESLDAIFQDPLPHVIDSVESKLFGLGAESYTVGSHEFYFGYATTRNKWLCLDLGHFHPTESVADKLSSVLAFTPGVLVHVSRPVRWDSDHVVTASDELAALAREIIVPDHRGRVRLGLDYFDASINRVAAWVIGTRALLRSLLVALLEPPIIRNAEVQGDLTGRLAWQEEARLLPYGAVWDYYCAQQGVPVGARWLETVREYEKTVLAHR